MKQYLELVQDILDNGETRGDRTGTGTLSVFGRQTRYDLREGFPLVTTKKVYFRSVVRELLWFLKGSTNINEGLSEFTKIWDPWADKDGNVGRIYGAQWRDWSGIDQIREALSLIKSNPDSRRIIVNAWNVTDLPGMALPPCHLLFQFYVVKGRLDCQLYQRSADIALGVPFNIASYALLMTIMARSCGLKPGVFVHTMGDAHIYVDHVEGLKKQLKRQPLELPSLDIPTKDIDDYIFEDIKLCNYQHHDFIKFPISV